jgi:hypothetical protein
MICACTEAELELAIYAYDAQILNVNETQGSEPDPGHSIDVPKYQSPSPGRG